MESENGDEEISIDFSKIKNFFKGKKKEKIEEKTKKEEGESEDSDEISIDFSKIKNFFKGKKKVKEEEVKIESKERKAEDDDVEEDEISVDFSKIKNFFRNLLKTKEVKSEDEEEVSLETKKIAEFINKNKSQIITLVLILIPVFFSIYLRIQPAYLPITEQWARSAVYNQIKSQIRAEIDKQYPNLPDANKNALVEREFSRIEKEQRNQIKGSIKATSDYFKTRLQNKNGQTYLLAIDPYYWMRHAKNILEKGHPGDEIRNGVPYDNHMYAPVGRPVPDDMLHAYVIAYFHKFLSFFNRDADLMSSAFYLPVILSTLAVIPAFLIGKRLGGNFGGFVAGFIMAIHPALLTRTAGGFSDTDSYNVLLPLFITWLFLEAFETKKRKKMVIYSALAGILTGIFSFAWTGWFYIFDFILVSSIVYLIFLILFYIRELKNVKEFVKKPDFYNTLLILFVFMVFSGISVSLFRGFSTFKDGFIGGPVSFATLKQVAITTIWPNVYTTVAEQNPASLNSVISQIGIGSVLLFLIGITGIMIILTKKGKKSNSDIWFIILSFIWLVILLGIGNQKLHLFLMLISLPIVIRIVLIIKERNREIDIKAAILLVLWFMATIYAGVKGVRYILLAVPAFAISFGVTLSFCFYYLYNLISKGLRINKKISKAIVIILLLAIAGILPLPFPPFCFGNACRSALVTAKNEIPSMNDAWYESLQKIDIEAKPNAIINSWWDFGHWFKAIGDRAVTFDGTSQNTPNAHWIGSVLLTDDEKFAVGILRMVDCGQNRAFEKLNEVLNDTPKSIDILEKIIRFDKEEARRILLDNKLKEDEIEGVLNYTHCEPPEDYFITSQDMVGKSGVWAHFGSWDFKKALIYNTLKREKYKGNLEKSILFLQNRFNYSREKAEEVYYEVQAIKSDSEANTWIAPWPSYGGTTGCREIEEKIACSIGRGAEVKINLSNLQADIETLQGIMHPNSIVLPIKNGSFIEKKFNNTVGVSITLIPKGDNKYDAIILSPQLAKSMFTRMFYLNGHGLKYFDKFSDTRDISGARIIIWKVNWQGNSSNLLEYYQKEKEKRNIETKNESLVKIEHNKGNEKENKTNETREG